MVRTLPAGLLLVLAACIDEKVPVGDTAGGDTAVEDAEDTDTAAADTAVGDTAGDTAAPEAPPFPDLGCTLTQPWPVASAEDVSLHFDHILGILVDLTVLTSTALDAAEATGCPAAEGVLDEDAFDLRGPCTAGDTSFDGRFTGSVTDDGSAYAWEGVTFTTVLETAGSGTWEADGIWDATYGEEEEHTFDLDLTVPSGFGGPTGHLVYRSSARLLPNGFVASGYVSLEGVSGGPSAYPDGDFCYLDDLVSTDGGTVGTVAVKGSAEAIVVFDGASRCAPLWIDGVVAGELCPL